MCEQEIFPNVNRLQKNLCSTNFAEILQQKIKSCKKCFQRAPKHSLHEDFLLSKQKFIFPSEN